MFGGMGYTTWTTDDLEKQWFDEAESSRIAATKMAILEELHYRQVATADGCRSLSEWATARLDLHPDNAKTVVRTMRRTVERPDLRDAPAGGTSPSTVWKPYPGPGRGWNSSNTWMWPGCAGMQQSSPVSTDDEYRTALDQFLVL